MENWFHPLLLNITSIVQLICIIVIKAKLPLHSIFLSNKCNTCNKRAVQAEISPAFCYVLTMARKLKNGKIYNGKEFRFDMEPPLITQTLNLLTHQLRLIHKLYCWNLMMAFLPTVCTLFLSFMKVCDQGLYLHSQPTWTCFVTQICPRSNKQTKTSSSLSASTTGKGEWNYKECNWLYRMAHRQTKSKWQDVFEKSSCHNLPVIFKNTSPVT